MSVSLLSNHSHQVAPEQLCERFVAHALKLRSPVTLPVTHRPLVNFIDRVLHETQLRPKTYIWLNALRLIDVAEFLRIQGDPDGVQPHFPVNPGVYFVVALMVSHQYHKGVEIFPTSLMNAMTRNVPSSIQHRDLTLWVEHMFTCVGKNITPHEMKNFKQAVYNVYFNRIQHTTSPVSILRFPESMYIQSTCMSRRPPRPIPSREKVQSESSIDEAGELGSASIIGQSTILPVAHPLPTPSKLSRKNTCPSFIPTHPHPATSSRRRPVQKATTCPEPIPHFLHRPPTLVSSMDH